MHRGIISCTLDHTVATVAKIMVDEEIHAVVVMDDQGRAVGVVSQTDMVLARQGRTPDQARSLRAAEIDDLRLRDLRRGSPVERGCEPDDEPPDAHRLVVTDKDQPVGVISMTDVVRKIIGE